MLDQDGANNLFHGIHENWIKPELQRRWPEGVPPDFRVRRCLIRMPIGAPPIVEFNEEIRWMAHVKLADHVEGADGQDVYLADIERINAVQPPEVDGKRVAFIFLFRLKGSAYNVIFDASPNSPDIDQSETAEQWDLGKHIAAHLQDSLAERAVAIPETSIEHLEQIGLWPAPSLLPYPLTKIVQHLEAGQNKEAIALLVRHCQPAFLQKLIERWENVPAFKARATLFQQALEAHKAGQYALPIFALLPQIEGVVTDWLLTKIPETEIPWRAESKTKKFHDVISAAGVPSAMEKRIVEKLIGFILKGPVLKSFKKWSDAIDVAFPGRHPVGHGRFDPAFINEENSIKVFLLLDTLSSVMAV